MIAGGRMENRERREEISKRIKNCSRCRPHSGENARRKQRSDRYKSRRRGR